MLLPPIGDNAMKPIISSEIGKKVRVYRNQHQDCWSVMHKGKLIGHAMSVELKDVNLLVLRGGYERYQREQRKNVHAFVQGILVNYNQPLWTIVGTEVTYSPKQQIPLFRTVRTDVFKGREFYFDPQQTLKCAFCAEKTVWVSNRDVEPSLLK